MTHSPSNFATGNFLYEGISTTEEYDEVAAVLDLLNLKVAARQPGDVGYWNETDQHYHPPLIKDTIIECSDFQETDELTKWKNYAGMLERRVLGNDPSNFLVKSYERPEPETDQIQKAYEETKENYFAMMKKASKYRKQSLNLTKKVGEMTKKFKKERGNLLSQIKTLTITNQANIMELEQKNKSLQMTACESNSKVLKLQDKIVELEKEQENLKTKLENKSYYVGQMKRIMDQQQQVLRNSKDKHKKVKEELEEKIMELHLNLAARDIEIEKLTDKLKMRHERKKTE